MKLQSGQRVGSCEIVAPLREGGMGEVYRARDTKRNRDVAIKVLPYPGPGPRTQISIDVGTEPLWSRDGHELFYQAGVRLLAVPVTRPLHSRRVRRACPCGAIPLSA